MNIFLLWVIGSVIYFIYKTFKKHRENNNSEELDDESKQTEHIAKLFDERVIGDFILTKAAVPCLNNKIRPIEGFRRYDIDESEKHIKVVAALSAEKTFNFLIDAIHLVGDIVNISFVDYGKDYNKVHEYFCFSKDTFLVESILAEHKLLMVNNGDIHFSCWSLENRFEMQLDRVKHFIFYTDNIASLNRLFDFYEIGEKESIQFFPEGEHFIQNEFSRTPELLNLLNKLEIEDTKTYNAEADQDTP
jgi:hypothetical protein